MKNIKYWWLSIDKWIFYSTLVLILVGFFLILSSSSIYSERLSINSDYLIKKHLIILPFAILLILMTSCLPIEKIIIFSFVFFLIFLILSIVPIFFFNQLKGANRWINIFNFSLQPTEFLKPTFVIVTSTLLTRFHKKKDYSMKVCFLIILSISVILLKQPDFGMFVLIFITWFSQILLFGIKLHTFFLLSLFGVTIFLIAYSFLDHVKFRIDNFLNFNSSDNYQISKSIDSFISGGFFGQGIGGNKVSQSLPDVHSDFIFSLAAEELGFFSLCFILSLYFIIFSRSVYHSYNQKSLFKLLSISGLSIIFFLQSILNILNTIGLIPTTGMTLPFLSYGGSSLLSCAITIGFILSVSKKNYE